VFRPAVDKATHRRTCYFKGRVQGVGFRYTVKNIAMQYDVLGYVKNLPDGRVELVMEGPEDEINAVINEVNRKMGNYVADVGAFTNPATGEFEQFSIRL